MGVSGWGFQHPPCCSLRRGRPDIQWSNLDPLQLMEELGQFTSLEGFKELLDKAEVGQAYMERPCLDPRDPQCPPSAPNKQSQQVGDVPWGQGARCSPACPTPLTPPSLCWQSPDIPAELSGGCHGFSRKFMRWQEELILGGTTKDSQGKLLRYELSRHAGPRARCGVPAVVPMGWFGARWPHPAPKGTQYKTGCLGACLVRGQCFGARLGTKGTGSRHPRGAGGDPGDPPR